MMLPALPACLALLCATPVSSAPRPASAVEYREAVMKSLAGHMRALTLITAGAGYAEHAALHADSIDAIARILPSLFPPGTGPESVKTEALAAVWKDAAGFRTSAERLQAETARLVRAAKDKDAAALRARAEDVSKACSACHDTYRASR